ncbi:unnamed protein product [Calypogeia fissa]
MAATSMASLTVTAALPGAVSCSLSSSSNGSAAKMSSSANMVGMRLHTVAAPSSSRSSRSLIVRAEGGSIWDMIKSWFGAAKEEASKLTAEAEKEVKKLTKEAKEVSGELGGKAEDSKEEAEVKAEEAIEEVADGIAKLEEKVEDAVETARAKANN